MNPCDLLLVPRAEVIALAERLAQGCAIEHRIVPRAGSWLLRLTEGVRGDQWFIGEVPAAQAAISLRHPERGEARGAAVLLFADAELAAAIAVLDAVARASWPGHEAVAALAARGAACRCRAEAVRAAIREATRVVFSELGSEDDA